MGPRGMASETLDPDLDVVRCRHDRTGPYGERADRKSWTVMHAVDLLDAKTIHQAVLDHRVGAGTALFRGLEDHHGIAGKIAGLGQVARRAQQYRSVTVVAAGMHLARRL